MSEGTATAIEPGVVARVVQGVRYMFTGKGPGDWFGPGEPLAPVAQGQADGRIFDYPFAYNTNARPRSGEPIDFQTLRTLADSCDLVRLAIETRKDQMDRIEWQVRPIDRKKNPEDDPRCKELTEFLMCPDREHDWNTWLRMLLEDLLVLDAPTIYPRKTRGGGVYSLDLIDGATIKRVLSSDGRTPMPPDPAYQQILKGLPAVDYTRDELLYRPRNPRTNRVYGFSPVEQVLMIVNIILRREISQLQYYTEGNIPDAIYTVPDTWNPDQIKQFQTYWDAMIEGNTASRRHAKFVPNGIKMQESRDPKLKDEYDEWLARVVCYAFSLPPTALVKQVNRATGQQQQDTADEEGLAPTIKWTCVTINEIIRRWFGYTDLECAPKEEEAQDPLQQANVAKIYVDAKVLHPDEVREDLGREPLTAEQKDDMNPPMPEPGLEPGKPGKPKPGGAAAAEKLDKKKALEQSTVIERQSHGRVLRSGSY